MEYSLAEKPVLVLVHIGPHFPAYLNTCIAQVRKYSEIEIVVLINKVHEMCVVKERNVRSISLESVPTTDIHNQFKKTSTLDKQFRNGFWNSATERFFYMYDFVVQESRLNVFHIEYDNLIYMDFAEKLPVFQTKQMWCVMENLPGRCIPSFMYFRDKTMLEQMVNALVKGASRNKNDMFAIAEFVLTHIDAVGILPIVDSYCDPINPMLYEHAARFGCVFDGAAIGQYIGGVDPRNIPGETRGFINREAIIKCDKLLIGWKGPQPFMNGLPIVNLHIHSKDLARWAY